MNKGVTGINYDKLDNFANEFLVKTNKSSDYESFESLYNSFNHWSELNYNDVCPYLKRDFIEYFLDHDYKINKDNIYEVKIKDTKDNDSINDLLLKAAFGTEYDLAKVIHGLYKDQFVCASINRNRWYQFKTHRWIEIEYGYVLHTKISEEVPIKLFELGIKYFEKMIDSVDEIEKDSIIKKICDLTKIMNNLKKSKFKERIFDECKNLFYDKSFEEKLDSNRDLIGFNNGIFDLKLGIFRNGSPNDFVSATVGYDYEEFSKDHAYILGIKDFFSKVQPELDMREYILTLLASYLDGYTYYEQFILWTGTKKNDGRSAVSKLFQLAFGEYYGILPNHIITRKRGDPGRATPELAEMMGKRLAVFQNLENDTEIQVGMMKELTGGDCIMVRQLFRDPIIYKPQFKLLLICDKLPYISSNDNGTWRRIKVVPWSNEVGIDYGLDQKLELWKKAFLWYLLKVYYPIYKNRGLDLPEKVIKFTQKYKQDSDVFLEFMNYSLDIAENSEDSISFDALYITFKYWYTESCSGKIPYAKKDLINYLSNNHYIIDKKNLYGINFKKDDDDNLDD